MSKLLSITLTDILKYSQKHQWDNMSPQPAHHFVYQKDTTVRSYHKVFESKKSDKSYKYCTILTSDPWKEYIKDSFNKDKTKAYLAHTALESKKALNPPFGITFENLTNDAGTIEQSKQLLDVRHYNAYLLIPRLVYHLSTKLHRQIMSQRLGKNYEIDLIHFMTRFGYEKRTSPYCKLHGAYISYKKVKNVLYVNDCRDKERIILVTLFLIMLFNACFTYQESNASNMLVDALEYNLNFQIVLDQFELKLIQIYYIQI